MKRFAATITNDGRRFCLLAKPMGRHDPFRYAHYYNDEMEQCANDYAFYVMELTAEAQQTCKEPVVLIEQRPDFSRYVPDGFGTGDCVIISDGTLCIVDYKHGKGVEVSADENPQLMKKQEKQESSATAPKT